MPNVAKCIWTGPYAFQAAAPQVRWPRSIGIEGMKHPPDRSHATGPQQLAEIIFVEVPTIFWGIPMRMAMWTPWLHGCHIMMSWTTASTSEWNTITSHSQTNTLRLPNILISFSIYAYQPKLSKHHCRARLRNWPATFSKKICCVSFGHKTSVYKPVNFVSYLKQSGLTFLKHKNARKRGCSPNLTYIRAFQAYGHIASLFETRFIQQTICPKPINTKEHLQIFAKIVHLC
jgi:hypothetical protein